MNNLNKMVAIRAGAVVAFVVLAFLLYQVPSTVNTTAVPTTVVEYDTFLPLVRAEGTAVSFYDCDFQPSSEEWFKSYFTPLEWLSVPTSTVSSFVCCGVDWTVTMILHLVDENDMPVIGQDVVVTWDGAPWLPAEDYCHGLMHGVVVTSDIDGQAKFVMGKGARYWPPSVGPHTICIP